MVNAGSGRSVPVNRSRTMGLSARSGRLKRADATSMRNPSAPRSSQKAMMRSNSERTSGFHQLRSGCSGAKRWRYHLPLAESSVQAGPPNADVQLFGGEPSAFGSAQEEDRKGTRLN